MKDIHQLALRCKSISDERVETIKTRFIYGSIAYLDYTLKGAVGEYLDAVKALCIETKNEYPAIDLELRMHLDHFNNDKMIHYTAIRAIVDCLLALESRSNKKIFISHSSKDKELIGRFVDNILLLGIGLNHEDIFCTSIEEMGVKNGEDMRKHIRENMQSADFSFLMISKNYKASEICLNEMGAVWATDNQVRYYLLPDVDFDGIGWLCDTNKADKIGDPVAMDALAEELITFYELPRKGSSWSRHRQSFLDYLLCLDALEKL